MVSSGAAWAVLVCAGRTGNSSPLKRTLGENSGASWWKTTGLMARQSVRAASWASLMVLLKLVVSIGTVGFRVRPWLRKLSDGQPLVQVQLAVRHVQALAFTHLTLVRCVQHWGVMRNTGLAVMAVPIFLGLPH